MQIKKHIVIVIFIAFNFPWLLHSQPANLDEVSRHIKELQTSNLKRKNENAALLKELELIKQGYSKKSKPSDSLGIEINRLQRLDSDRQKQLETLLTISGNTSSHVGNKLDSISILLSVFALGLSLGGIFLGFYINKKEKNISKIIDRGEENLRRQAESEQRAEQTRELIHKDLTSLYNKLREEELRDIFKKLSESAGLISPHSSRLLTIDLREEHFIQLKNLFLKWHLTTHFSRENWMDYVIVLISHFPSDVAANQELLPVIKNGFSVIFPYIMTEKLMSFFRKLTEDFFENKYPEVGDYLLKTIEALSEVSGPKDIAKLIFELNENKANRFKLYSLMKNGEVLMVKAFYADWMITTYSDASKNTDEENVLMTEMRAPYIPPDA